MLFTKSTFFFDTDYEKEDSWTFFGVNYQSFGSPMTGRTFDSQKYRFGFNGKENDNEVKGQGAQQDYGFRIYDPRLGRFLSVDPLLKDYPSWSTYAFAMNRPIDGVDLDGLEWSKSTNLTTGKDVYTVKVKVLNSSTVMTKAQTETAMAGIAAYANNSFSGDFSFKDVEFNVETEFVTEVDRDKDFYVEFVDEVEGGSENTTGKVNSIGNTESNRIQVKSGMSEANTSETGAHEIGHTGGLFHESSSLNPKEVKDSMGKDNIMNATGFGNTKSTPEQIGEFDKNIPKEKQTITFENDVAEPDNTKVVPR
jgi:RHS repeat-associated protein